MEAQLKLDSHELHNALANYQKYYDMFINKVRCTFTQAKSDLLSQLSSFPSPSATMTKLMQELREEQKESIILPEEVTRKLEQSGTAILVAVSGQLLQHWIVVCGGTLLSYAYFVTEVNIDPYNAHLFIAGPSVVFSGVTAPNTVNYHEYTKVLLTSLNCIKTEHVSVVTEDDLVKMLNEKVTVYRNHIDDVIKFVHETTITKSREREAQ